MKVLRLNEIDITRTWVIIALVVYHAFALAMKLYPLNKNKDIKCIGVTVEKMFPVYVLDLVSVHFSPRLPEK